MCFRFSNSNTQTFRAGQGTFDQNKRSTNFEHLKNKWYYPGGKKGRVGGEKRWGRGKMMGSRENEYELVCKEK